MTRNYLLTRNGSSMLDLNFIRVFSKPRLGDQRHCLSEDNLCATSTAYLIEIVSTRELWLTRCKQRVTSIIGHTNGAIGIKPKSRNRFGEYSIASGALAFERAEILRLARPSKGPRTR